MASMTDIEIKYPAFGKIPRWNREVIITEKIDGTNGLISIEKYPFGHGSSVVVPDGITVVHPENQVGVVDGGEPAAELWVRAGSRNRWLTTSQDNYGFGKWVERNAYALASVLGTGHHYGEWWGLGIQRGYGLDHKRFSLFNTSRWDRNDLILLGGPYELDVVPVIHIGSVTTAVETATQSLRNDGSQAALGYMDPEGMVIYHVASRCSFKVTLINDDKPKG